MEIKKQASGETGNKETDKQTKLAERKQTNWTLTKNKQIQQRTSIETIEKRKNRETDNRKIQKEQEKETHHETNVLCQPVIEMN